MNRNDYDLDGRQMSVPYQAGMRYFDLYHGVELHPVREGDQSVLSFAFEAHGYGAILATAGEPSAQIEQLMAKMKGLTATPLSSYSHEWKPLLQTLVAVRRTASRERCAGGDGTDSGWGFSLQGGGNRD